MLFRQHLSFRKFSLIAGLALSLIGLSDSYGAGDQGTAEIRFSRGTLAFQAGRYEDAEGLFAEALRLNPSHRSAAYFLGMSRFHQDKKEKYEQAVSAFGAVIDLGAEDPEPFFYRGVSLYRLEKGRQALGDFQRVIQLVKEGPLKDLAASYLKNIEESGRPAAAQQTKRWSVYGSLSTDYDSNVSLNPENLTLASLPTDRSDIQIGVRAGGRYDVIQKEKYRLTPEASYYQIIYPQLNSFNYGLAYVGMGQHFQSGNLFLNLPLFYEFALLGKSKYVTDGGFGPSVGFRYANYFLSQLTTEIRYDAFFQTLTNVAQDRDALNLTVEAEQFLMSEDPGQYLKVFYLFEKNWAQGADWDYHAHTLGASLVLPLWWEMSLDLHGEVSIEKKFENVDSVIGTQRDDLSQSFGLSLSKKIGRHFDVSGHYDAYRNVSNQAFFTYVRHLTGVTLATSF